MNPKHTPASSSVPFHVLAVALELIEQVRTPLAQIQQHDGDLAKQLRRAASSVPLNLSEGNRRVGKDRRHFFRIAAGSADEVRACLRVALAWGYCEHAAVAESLARVDRVLAMTHRLTH